MCPNVETRVRQNARSTLGLDLRAKKVGHSRKISSFFRVPSFRNLILLFFGFLVKLAV
jgi:hypothetical protein